MQSRDLTYVIKRGSKSPVVILSGPKEVGKTTLVKSAFKNHKYVSFADADTRLFATNDPERFLSFYKNDVGIILDDIELAYPLLPYLQTEALKKPGYFIVVSSEKIPPQALSKFTGNVALLTLLPSCVKELEENNIMRSIDEHMVMGGYPESSYEWHTRYLQSFLDLQIKPCLLAKNVPVFEKFMQLCAGQIGLLLNLDMLAEECGISFATAFQWLSLMETHFLIFLLPAHTESFKKRLTKTPKLYFLDTGIASSLLRISTPEILAFHPLRSKLFENFMVADLYKQFCNNGQKPAFSFWRDQNGRYEIDCLIKTESGLTAIDIRSGQTLGPDCFKKLLAWNTLSQSSTEQNFIFYAGVKLQQTESGTLMGWQAAGEFIEKLT